MSKRKLKKSGSPPRRRKAFAPPRRRQSAERVPTIPRVYVRPPRTDAYLDDGPERDEEQSLDGPWGQIYRVTRDGHTPFVGDGHIEDFAHIEDDDAWQAACDAACESAHAEGRDVMEMVTPRAEIPDVFDEFTSTLETPAMREVAPTVLALLLRYVDSILRPTAYVIVAWIHPDRFAEALRTLAPDLTDGQRSLAFAVLAAFFRWLERSGAINLDRAMRLGRDFDALAASSSTASVAA